ncbi:MAG: helix-turn-helix domain-containing protein [Bacteroidaceae bacterium]|nr:helix-turn-helix domain-containing protein [Bacteroidaceae bacterium]
MRRSSLYLYICLSLLAVLSGTAAPVRMGQALYYGPEQLGCSQVTAITQTRDGLLWVGTAHGLCRFDGYRFTAAETTNGSGDQADQQRHGWASTEVTALLSDEHGRLWAGMAHGLLLYDRAADRFQPVAFPDSLAPRVATLSVRPDGLLLAGTAGYGYFLVDTLTLDARPLTGTIPQGDEAFVWIEGPDARLLSKIPQGVLPAGAQVLALLQDRAGNLWVGCRQHGLLMVPLHQRVMFHEWSRQDSHLLAASEGQMPPYPSHPEGVESIYRDSTGRFWLGTANELWTYDVAAQRATKRAVVGGDRVNLIRHVSPGCLAVSTFGAGLVLYDMAADRMVRHLSMHDTDTAGHGVLNNDWIFDLDTDRRGRLWLATSSGVCCYDPVQDSFHTETFGVLANGEMCTALRVLKNSDVLIAGERGLLRWSRQDGLHPEQGTEALHGQVAYMEEDTHGDIWLSTHETVWQWSPSTQKLVSYAGAYGLWKREFVLGSGFLTPGGQIFLGTTEGFVAFSPDSLRQWRQELGEVHLTAFVIGNQVANTLTLSNGRRVMKEATGDCHHFSVSYVDATFRMEFSLLDFVNTEGVTFEYRLNDERQWLQTAKGENGIAFSHLPPGRYELQVRAHSGGEYTTAETYYIRVRPPWWLSIWALVIYVLLFLTGVAAVAVLYRRHLRNQMDREKLHFLMSAINTQDAPLTLEDMKRAISSFVHSRQQQRSVYGNSSAVVDRMERPEVQGNDEALMERIVQSVNQHLDDSEFAVEQLCSEVGISRAHLHRKMKEMTGMPVTEFIRNIRLEQAARLLRERKLNITQVAYSVGFSNLGYFSTVFRKHFGVSPRDFEVGTTEDTE